MKETRFKLSLLTIAAVLLFSVPAYADSVSLTLTNPVQSGASGPLLFEATVTAPSSNSGTVFLNGDEFAVDVPLTMNDDGFFFGFPFFLNPGDTFTGLLFTVDFPPTTPQGTYNGSFSILGGADGSSFGDIADVTYQVNVTPEPGSLILFATGLSGIATVVRRRRYTAK